MKKMRIVVTVIAAMIFTTGSVYAQEQKRFHGGGEEGGKGKIFKELNLTPDQEKKIEDNRKAQRQEMQKLREAIRANHQKLQAKFKDSAVTRAAVEPLVSEINVLQAKLVENRINGIFAVKSILTPEQFVKFNELMENRAKNRMGRSKDARGKLKGPHAEME